MPKASSSRIPNKTQQAKILQLNGEVKRQAAIMSRLKVELDVVRSDKQKEIAEIKNKWERTKEVLRKAHRDGVQMGAKITMLENLMDEKCGQLKFYREKGHTSATASCSLPLVMTPEPVHNSATASCNRPPTMMPEPVYTSAIPSGSRSPTMLPVPINTSTIASCGFPPPARCQGLLELTPRGERAHQQR